MEPVYALIILLVGLVFGGIMASLLVKTNQGSNLAAGEAEVAAFKARIGELERTVAELRAQVESERQEAHQLQLQLTEAAVMRAAAEERATQTTELKAVVEEKERALGALAEENSTLKARHASLMTRLDEAEKAQAEKLQTLEAAQARLADTFKGMAAEALASNNQNFLTIAQDVFRQAQEGARGDLETRQRSIDDMLKPLRETLEKIERERVESTAGLSEQVKMLHAAQLKVEGETSKLVNALRTPAVRGRWGEMQLRRTVEMAGMVEYCDFEEQVSVETEGGRQRPDMLIRMPSGRVVVIDAKVSLAAYLDSLEAADEAVRQQKLADHAGQVRQHVQRLAAKAYWEQFPDAPDFVVAFLPGETFFSAALQKDPELIEYGVENKVLLATPTTLIAMLKAVAYGWRQEKLQRNAQQISDLGRELYERLRVFAGHMDSVRTGLERTVESYNKAAGSFEGRVLVSARRFQELSGDSGEVLAEAATIDKVPRKLQSADLTLASSAHSGVALGE